MKKPIVDKCQSVRETAMRILTDQEPYPKFAGVEKLVKGLKACHEYGLARKLLDMARAQKNTVDQSVWLTQQLALCTYKDEELLPARRFEDALGLLESIGLYEPGNVDPALVPAFTLPETLALGGAIKKRMFEHNGQLEHLYDALALYRSAWKQDPIIDRGYGGVNAAYILDQLAVRLQAVATRTGTTTQEADRLRQEAHNLRQEILAVLLKASERNDSLLKEYWPVVTLAEASFGIGKFQEAGDWLAKAKQLKADEWEQQTTFRQLVSLARLQGYIPPSEKDDPAKWAEPWRALAKFFEEDAELAFSCWRGKVGLALSGGGFRASLYHLGVLARLAEIDVLRSVEVLSTVSGGSIVGAHYYLSLQKLLTNHSDKDIRREDYINLVLDVQLQFLKAVQKNLRMRTLSNLWCNLKMLLPRMFGTSVYSRSHRMGELFESMIYNSAGNGQSKRSHRIMSDLIINPNPCGNPFKPKFSNWRRRAKVPIFLINATSLNTGHNWQFTASWMGEPPGLLGKEVDTNTRYRRLYYWQAPLRELREYRLGYAVAASACVPVLFTPLEIKRLYPGHTVRLVDGGVHDNQGVQGLLDESCTFILCSDASGQMEDEPSPSNGMLGVSLRSSAILQDRVRESQYQDIMSRKGNHALDGLFFIHLKKDLKPKFLDWIKCQDPKHEPLKPNTTSYGIDRELQGKLAAIRTDLDTFTEVEAYSLMLSGYLMTEYEFKDLDEKHHAQGKRGHWGGFEIDADRDMRWPFLCLLSIIDKTSDSPDLRRKDLAKQLDVGASNLLKVWRLYPALQTTATVILVLIAATVLWLLFRYWDRGTGVSKLGPLVLTAAFVVAGSAWTVLKWLNPWRAMRGWLTMLVLSFFGWIVSNIHIHVFDPLYRRRGKLERLLKLPSD